MPSLALAYRHRRETCTPAAGTSESGILAPFSKPRLLSTHVAGGRRGDGHCPGVVDGPRHRDPVPWQRRDELVAEDRSRSVGRFGFGRWCRGDGGCGRRVSVDGHAVGARNGALDRSDELGDLVAEEVHLLERL